MVYGVGIDISRVDRFESFPKYSRERLLDIYTESELRDLESAQDKSQFLASRFAAKEAFYKAISHTLVFLKSTDKTFNFQFARKQTGVNKTTWDLPCMIINWAAFEEKLGIKLPKMNVHLSLSHEKSYAVAVVTISG